LWLKKPTWAAGKYTRGIMADKREMVAGMVLLEEQAREAV